MSKLELGVVVTLLLAILSGVYLVGELNGRLTAVELDKDYESFRKEKTKTLDDLTKTVSDAIKNIQNEGEKVLASLSSQDQRIADLETRTAFIEGATRFAFVENESKCPGGWDYFMKSVTAADPANADKAIASGMDRAQFNFGGYPGVHFAYCIRKK